MRVLPIILVLSIFVFPQVVSARVTPNDLYKEKIEAFEATLVKISDSAKREKVSQSDQMIYDINQSVCSRFEEEIAKLSAILEELKRRTGITETVVAYGKGDTPLDDSAYWVNWAAEALAYQKIQDYTPQITPSNFVSPIQTSQSKLRNDLIGLRGKILKAAGELQKGIDYVQK